MEKELRLKEASRKKENCIVKFFERKVTETENLLPRREKIQYEELEKRKKLLELKQVKENLWKRWRESKENKENDAPQRDKEKLRNKLQHLEEILETVKENARLEQLRKDEERKVEEGE